MGTVAKLSKAEAMQAAHEVAAWMAYEREAGAFGTASDWKRRTGIIWSVGPRLNGGCLIASTILAAALRARGHAAGVVNHATDMHMLVSTHGMLIDATAAQFGHDGPVVVRWGRRNAVGIGASPELMLRAHLTWPKEYQRHPCWPVNHVAVIVRILRRMGAEDALRRGVVEVPRGS